MESFWRWWSRLRGVKPEPSQGSLDAALREMRRVRVWHWGAVSDGRLKRELLFETDQSEALSALRDTLRIVDGSAGHCMCLGDPLIECLGPANQPLAEISVHHGQRIRWEAWLHDAQLVDGRRLVEWLADRGVRYPLLEYEEGLRREEAQRTAWNRTSAHGFLRSSLGLEAARVRGMDSPPMRVMESAC
jgi:hypothetical protein